MNKKLNKKIFSGVLALSFVFGSGLVSTVSDNLGLEYSNVAYADSVWDIPKDGKDDWIRASTLEEMGYPRVDLSASGYGDSHDLSLKNGKVYYLVDNYYGPGIPSATEKKLLPDKGYSFSDSGYYTSHRDFLIDHGYEVRQERLYTLEGGLFKDFFDANNVIIWNKIKKENEIYNPVANKISVNSKTELTPEKAKSAIKKGSVPDDSSFRFVDTTTDLTVGDNKRKVEITYKKDSSKDLVDVTVSYLPDDIKLEDYDKLNDTDKKLYSVIEFRNADKTTTMVRLKSVLNKGTVEAPKPEPKAGYTVEWELTAQ